MGMKSRNRKKKSTNPFAVKRGAVKKRAKKFRSIQRTKNVEAMSETLSLVRLQENNQRDAQIVRQEDSTPQTALKKSSSVPIHEVIQQTARTKI